MTPLEKLYFYWGCENPLNFIGKFAAHVVNHQKYYRQFLTVKDLFAAVEKRVIHGRVWSDEFGKWVVVS